MKQLLFVVLLAYGARYIFIYDDMMGRLCIHYVIMQMMWMLLLQIEAWDEAIKSCNNVLKVQPDNVKALFRKAKVSYALYVIVLYFILSIIVSFN